MITCKVAGKAGHSRRFLRVLVMSAYPPKLTVAGGRATACLYHIAAASPGEPPRAEVNIFRNIGFPGSLPAMCSL
jgi:hypothetical protein